MSFNPPTIQLPKGVTFDYTATPKFSTILQVPQSGRHPASATLQDSTIFDLDLTFDYLTEASLQYLRAFYEAMRGAFGWFLFDPSQYDLANLTLTQDLTKLQNGFSGVAPGMNYLLQSQALNLTPWALGAGAGSVLTPNASTDPIGGSTATEWSWPGGTDTYLFQYMADTPIVGATYTFSVWLRVASGTLNTFLGIDKQSSTSVATQAVTVTSSWQRFSVSYTVASGVTQLAGLIGGFASLESAGAMYLWGAQLETGSAPQTYVPTTTIAVPGQTIFPLWRSSAVFDSSTVTLLERLQNVTSFAGLYVNGSLVSASDYTQTNLPAAVTFSVPPAAGDSVAWAGSYSYLCRFSDDTADFEMFLYQLYKLKTVKLTTVNL